MRKINGKIVAFLSSVVYYSDDLLRLGNRALVQKKHSLAYNLIVHYHYRTVYNKETITGEEILKSHVACLLTYKFLCVTTSAFPYRG